MSLFYYKLNFNYKLIYSVLSLGTSLFYGLYVYISSIKRFSNYVVKSFPITFDKKLYGLITYNP